MEEEKTRFQRATNSGRGKENNVKRILFAFGLLMMLAISTGAWAQQGGYSQTNLVSNSAGVAKTTDSQLLNPWGIAFVPGQDFWIANNNSGTSTLYDENGNKDTGLVVTIPGASANPNGNCSPGCPTGIVVNSTSSYFSGGQFIFDTEDGLIANWTGASNTATVAFDNSSSGAVYKGLALLNDTFLLAANFNSGKIDVLDRNFNLTSLAGSFTDPKLPAGLAPHGIHVIGNQVYVAYAMQDAAKHDAQPGAGLGQVDIFDANGNFVSTLVPSRGKLNAPWGVVQAPNSFGQFANAILVGDFGDGTINAYDNTGKFLGQLTDSSNKTLVNPGLWDMAFGGGGNSGDAGTLYITAGGSNQPNFPSGGNNTAVFAAVAPASAANGANFSLNLSSSSTTVPQGGSTNLMVSASSVGGFSSPISLSCTAPAGLTCAFSPTSISPGSSASSSTLTISAASAPPVNGYGLTTMATLLPGFGVFGILFGAGKKSTRKNLRWIGLVGVLLIVSLFALGCGGSNATNNPTGSQASMTVTGTSGAISHSSTVAITIN
jgi:uncharacterized protein (TIGR03118 family)